MDINTLTIGQVREVAALLGLSTPPSQLHPFEIGQPYFIRTVTHHLTGRLTAVYPTELVLTDAAWIASDGRFAQAVESGSFDEVEPYPSGQSVIVGRGSIIDATKITVTPRSQK